MVVVDPCQRPIAFLRATFGASGDVPDGRPAEVRIGDSLVIVSAAGERDPFPAFLYIYVTDADEACSGVPSSGAAEPRGAARHALRRQAGYGPRPLRQRFPDRTPPT